ncbi:MAG: hypothetical protein QF541_16710, partial [Lentisphaeria bacterium]|nr:hypothetical protein [Lentisphaeria bacterium]
MKHTQKIKNTIRSLALAVFGCLLMAGFTTNAGTSLDVDFEGGEGYSAGALPGQNGWVQSDSDGAADMAATVIDPAGNLASNGAAAAKFINPDAQWYTQPATVVDEGVYSPPLDGCAGETGCCATVFEQSFWVRTVDEAF